MNKSEKEKHHKALIEELEDVILEEECIRENQSPYLIDYLYGISDIDKQVNQFLEDKDPEEKWVLFYRCLLKKEFLEKKYNEFRKVNKNLFLIRDEEDFENWKQSLNISKKEEDISYNPEVISSEVESILNEILKMQIEKTKTKTKGKGNEIKDIDDLFNSEDIKKEFVNLLNRYVNISQKEGDEFEKCISKIDSFLREAYDNKNVQFTKTDFFTEILKINKTKISGIKKKYPSGVSK